MKQVNIYTDGACAGNQNENNLGGWGAILQFGSHEKELWGGEADTTNNRMELTALIEALAALKEDGLHLRIFSDSAYLVNCFKNKWYIKWRQNDWKNSKKKPVENRELWERLLELLAPHESSFFLVKGHVSEPTQADYKRFCTRAKEGANDTTCGEEFSFEAFCTLIEYNNRCDALANIYINEQRNTDN